MMEYRIARGWVVFMYLIGVALLVGGAGTIIAPVVSNHDLGQLAYLLPIGLVLIALGVYMFIAAKKWRLMITPESIKIIDVFKTKELNTADIKGVRHNEKFTLIVPTRTDLPTLKISEYVARREELTAWLNEAFTDLDAVEMQKEQEEILNDEQFGATPEERAAKLNMAKKTAQILNGIAGVLLLLSFIYPKPYQLICLGCFIMPWVALVPYYYFDGLIKIDESKASAYPSLLVALCLAPLGLMIRALLDYDILEYGHIWLPAIVLAVVFSAAVIYNKKAFKAGSSQTKWYGVFIFVLAMAYGYGATVFFNCYYDKQATQVYTVKVIDKHISSGKTTTYYLKLSAWGKQKEEEYSVGSDVYNNAPVGDNVNVYEMPGKLHVPWVIINN